MAWVERRRLYGPGKKFMLSQIYMETSCMYIDYLECVPPLHAVVGKHDSIYNTRQYEEHEI